LQAEIKQSSASCRHIWPAMRSIKAAAPISREGFPKVRMLFAPHFGVLPRLVSPEALLIPGQ
jgi:hypothetical protein